MIYLVNTTQSQTFLAHRTGLEVADNNGTFTLVSTVGNKAVRTLPTSIVKYGHHYVSWSITLPEGISNGGYEFTLTQCGHTVNGGLVQVGNYTPAAVQSEGSGIEIKQGK